MNDERDLKVAAAIVVISLIVSSIVSFIIYEDIFDRIINIAMNTILFSLVLAIAYIPILIIKSNIEWDLNKKNKEEAEHDE